MDRLLIEPLHTPVFLPENNKDFFLTVTSFHRVFGRQTRSGAHEVPFPINIEVTLAISPFCLLNKESLKNKSRQIGLVRYYLNLEIDGIDAGQAQTHNNILKSNK